jgi:hypothetical protein
MSTPAAHVYEGSPRKDKRGFDLISDALPFGGLWYTQVSDAIEYAEFYSRSNDVVIRVYDETGNVIETHDNKGGYDSGRVPPGVAVINRACQPQVA